MEKIKMTTPIVEMDGDEMTRVLWGMIKDELILPFIDLKTEYYDLGLLHRNETQDKVTVDAANATRKYGSLPKCGKARTEQFVQFLTERFSAHRYSSIPFIPLSKTGKSPLPLPVMPTVMFIKALTCIRPNPAPAQ